MQSTSRTLETEPKNDLKIAAVDDNLAHNYALERTLRFRGYQVQMAATGEELLRIVSADTNAVILDVNLPDINGFELCRRIRDDAAMANISIIFLTASSVDAASHDMAKRLGADAFLSFPVDPEQLDAVIRGTIAKRKSR
jgi:DNA-binding response OmpR family regulator